MKKLLFPLLMLIIGLVVGYYLCCLKSKSSTAPLESAMASGNYKSENSISYEEAKMMVDTFGTYGLQDASHRPGGKGAKTRSVFMPLTKLDSLVAALDAQRKKDGVTDGLRIYFGRYPKLQLDKKNYEHPFLNTLVFVTTKLTRVLQKGAKDSISIHLDFYGSTNRSKPLYMMAMDPQNRAELCPNNCDGATLVCPDPTDPDCDGN